nr:transcription initiation factor TFIID subunit 9 [Ipomoea batatas]
MRFLLRVMCWEYRQLPSIESVSFPRVLFMASPQTRQLKFQRSKSSVAEERAGRKLGGSGACRSPPDARRRRPPPAAHRLTLAVDAHRLPLTARRKIPDPCLAPTGCSCTPHAVKDSKVSSLLLVFSTPYFHSSRLQQAALAHCTLHSPVASGQRVYSEHAGKTVIDSDDLKLAVQSKVNFSFAPPPPREVLLELARSRNKIPLPKSISGPGIPLPPEQDTLISPNYQLAIPKKRTAQHVEETEEEEEGSDPNPASNQNQNLSQDRTDLPQEAPQRVSFPLGAKRPR